MDPKGPPGMMFAPGASRGATTIKQPPASGPAPTQEPHPRWTDHVVKEDDRWELVDGQRIEVMGAERPHGSAQVRITTLMNLFQVPESDAASDLLIRCDVSSDFAPDAALMREDPITGEASVPGLVFEISTTAKNMERAAKKAPLLTAAGVRRVFCLLLEGGPTLFEWDARARKFVSLREDAVIEDPLLAHPIPVRRVLDAKGAQIAIHDLNEAHDAEGEKRGLVKGEQVGLVKGEQIGLAKGLRVAVLGILEDRGLAVSEALRQRIVAEQSPEQLIQWRKRALHVARAEEIL